MLAVGTQGTTSGHTQGIVDLHQDVRRAGFLAEEHTHKIAEGKPDKLREMLER